MKKMLTLLLAVCLALLLTACGEKEIPEDRLQGLPGEERLFTDRLAGITDVGVHPLRHRLCAELHPGVLTGEENAHENETVCPVCGGRPGGLIRPISH